MRSKIQQLTASTLLLLGLASPVIANEPNISSRIVGGSETQINVVPATVALINNSALTQTGSYFQSQFCGGTVIGARWVLTAAHCLVADDETVVPVNDLSVLMGSDDLENPINQPVGVTRIIVHESYISTSHDYDIALLQLEYDALVPAVAIDQQTIQLNDIAFIAGWGALISGDNGQQQTFPTKLHGAFVRMVPGDECEQLFAHYRGQVDSSQLCAGRAEGQVDTCQGDSGGPLYRVSESSGQVSSITGITSWGIGCGEAATPGVYTNVNAYANWILTRTGSSTPVNDDPQTPSSPEPATGTALVDNDSIDLSSAGASSMLLPLLALLALIRKACSSRQANKPTPPVNRASAKSTETRKRRTFMLSGKLSRNLDPIKLSVVLAGIVAVTLEAQPMQADEKPSSIAISLATQPFATERDDVLQMAQALWQSEPVCTVVRTGYGMSRRAYFLETCTLTHNAQNTVLGESPGKVEYLFLESKLVQIAFDFDEIHDEKQFHRLAREQTEQLQAFTRYSIQVNNDFQIKVSDTEAVGHIHLLRNTL